MLCPDEAAEATEVQAETRPVDMRRGDLILGRFPGDCDLLLVRCDAACEDYGSVIVSLPVYGRTDWPTFALSLEGFLVEFIENLGDKFWER